VTSTATTQNPSAHPAGTHNAVIIPADPTLPIRGLRIRGLEDLPGVVGGPVQGFPCFTHAGVWGYTRVGSTLTGGEANARATSLLNPDGSWITGDAVLTASTLPPGVLALAAEPEALPDPTISARGNTAAYHAWEISTDEEHGWREMTVLAITLYPTLDGPVGLAEEYTAMLSTRLERPDLFGGWVCFDGLSTAHCVLRERGIAITRNNTSSFAARALATLNALYSVGERRVRTHFPKP